MSELFAVVKTITAVFASGGTCFELVVQIGLLREVLLEIRFHLNVLGSFRWLCLFKVADKFKVAGVCIAQRCSITYNLSSKI